MPPAEIDVDEKLVRELLRTQATTIADVARLPVRQVAEGWDNTLWRVGDAYAARLPRRAIAAPLTLHEHRVLPAIAARLAPTGVAVPAPVVQGRPGAGFPWAWSLVPWMNGDAALHVPRRIRSAWAVPLARALHALHAPAEPGYPPNPFRGGPLEGRAESVAGRFADLRARGGIDIRALDALERAWTDAVTASQWDGPPLWIHGDLHPGNLVADGDRLTGIIDFGDVTAGDPAYDLAIAWLAFDADGRAAFTAELGAETDAETWRRARGWAAAEVLLMLHSSDDNPDYYALGLQALGAFS